jgi:hypothetical protein
MNRVVSRLESAASTLAVLERKASTATIRSKWQGAPLDDLRTIAGACAEKRQHRQKPTEDDTAAESILFERSFRDFVPAAWPAGVPGVKLVWNRHHDLIAEALQAVVEGQIRRLLISCEPRSTKSTMLSVMLTAWIWTHDPAFRTINASMKSDLATRDSTICRRVIESRWYQSRWPVKLQCDQDTKARYENISGGHRVSVGVGQGTGDGGHLIAMDDPHPIDSASSEADVQAVISWWTSTMITRLDDPKTGRIIVAGQRIGKGDLIGHLLESGGYEHLCLPHEFEPARKSSIALPSGTAIEDWRTKPGELLWTSRCDEAATAQLKSSMPGDVYDALYQQRPRMHSGASAFPEFDAKLHVKPCPYDPSSPICWTLDFNVTPFVTLVLQHKDGVIRVIHEIDIDDIRTPIMCEAFVDLAIKNKWDLKGLTIFGDASGSQRRTSASESDWAIVQNRLRDFLEPMSVRVPAGNPPIKDTLNAIRAKLLSADGKTTLFIDPQCKRLIRDMESATWPSTMEECHALAGLRYFVNWNFPVQYEFVPARNVFSSFSIE